MIVDIKNVNKDYVQEKMTVNVLKDINLSVDKGEYIAIIGPSGSGKTTLMNIIGCLDIQTSGEYLLEEQDVSKVNDDKMSEIRNEKIGFVFQQFHLLPKLNAMENVALPLLYRGYEKEERMKLASEALEKVGLGERKKFMPNQLSGGQCQRVAIARAIAGNPILLLADEPTGALDTATSKQIMELLKKVSKDKLVIMVTHNPELATEYSTRIIKLQDGKVTDDSNPFNGKEKIQESEKNFKTKKTSMNFLTALSLSLNNLLTKKGRTILTAIAGSIGIIGIALILSLSNGFQNYIDKLQEDTLSSYPLTIQSETMDFASMIPCRRVISPPTAETASLRSCFPPL